MAVDDAVIKAYRRWKRTRPAVASIAVGILRAARKEHDTAARERQELAAQDSEMRVKRQALSARSLELQQEMALFNQKFGRPENFGRLKDDLDAREKALSWREQNVWASALPAENELPARRRGAMIGPHVWID